MAEQVDMWRRRCGAFLIAAMACGVTAAQPAPTGSASVTLPTSVQWFDGKQQRTAWLNANELADFGRSSVDEARIAAVDRSAVPDRREPKGGETRGARIWRVQDSARALAALAALGPAPTTSHPFGIVYSPSYSPVFHDAPDALAPRRALPGNVIVSFPDGWNDAQVRAWATMRRYDLADKLSVLGNYYLVRTPPGLASLEIANAIQQSGEVRSAQPNWWAELRTR